MKKMKWVLAAALMCGSMFFASCCDDDVPVPKRDDEPKTEYDIFLMSDIHVMAPELLVSKGTALKTISSLTRSCLRRAAKCLKVW